MPKEWSFAKLYITAIALSTAFTMIVFIYLGLHIIDHFFSYYVDKIHEETQHMLVLQATSHYRQVGNWKDHNAAQIGDMAKLSGDYFTIRDQHGRTIYSSETDLDPCCTNPNHSYTSVKHSLVVDGKPIGVLHAGYYKNHISSPEAGAFRKSGMYLVILAIVCVTLMGALVSLAFFYRISKPIRRIASTANEIARGHLQSRVAIQSKVAELNEISHSINALGSSLLQQEKFRQQLIVELSHELRTPLQILLNAIESILDGFHQPDTARLEAMHGEVARVSTLLTDLEDRLIYESDTFTLAIVPTDISEIATKVALGYEGSFARKNLHFSTDIAHGLVIPADGVRFAQVLINMLSNALKYTEQGEVSLIMQGTAAHVVVTIRDTGPGFSPDILKNIYTRNDLAFKGVHSKGVGLYIAKRIIDKHGWQVHIDSDPAAGARIRIQMG